jgi:uncharacterized membrane protein YeaQ/YmgE (transglycosylase-associated protein family)
MGILSWIIVGLIAGWLGTQFFRAMFGLVGDIILGVVSALVGGHLASSFYKYIQPCLRFQPDYDPGCLRKIGGIASGHPDFQPWVMSKP